MGPALDDAHGGARGDQPGARDPRGDGPAFRIVTKTMTSFPQKIRSLLNETVKRDKHFGTISRVGLRGGGGVGMGVSGMVFVGLVLGCIETKFCK